MESIPDHRPLPFLKAIGIPATATFEGREHKAFVFICGHEKGPEVVGPSIEIYIEGLHQFIPEEQLTLFEGPGTTDNEEAARAMAISVRRGKQIYRASNSVDLYMGSYPVSIVPEQDDNNVFGASISLRGPQGNIWKQFLREMSSGFEEGQISFGGKAPSSRIEIDFSGNGIEPLLTDLIRFVGP